MNGWTRLRWIEEQWHLEALVTPHGLTVVHCGVNYLPQVELETSALDAVAALDACDVCYAAFSRTTQGHHRLN